MKNIPNLFDYARKELSHDAIISWLLAWADEKYKDTDLHLCAQEFIRKFFEFNNIDLAESIETVSIANQKNDIDVLCKINGHKYIVIENKTRSNQSKSQLLKYRKVMQKKLVENNIEVNVAFIYYKIHDQDNLNQVCKDGFRPFLREDILKILNKFPITNAIYYDYKKYLCRLDYYYKYYEKIKLKLWNKESYIGFYGDLKKHLATSNPHWWVWNGKQVGMTWNHSPDGLLAEFRDKNIHIRLKT